MLIEYIGLAERVEDGYSVFFPDFPGFGSYGETLDETRKNAKEGLIAHIELMLEEEQILPVPSSLDNVIKLPYASGCIPLIISHISLLGKARRINITIDRGLLDALDTIASIQRRSRSALIAEATQRLLGEINS